MRPTILSARASVVFIAAPILWAVTAPATHAQELLTKSWLYIDPSCNTRVLTEGETWEIPVEYYLDPAEDDGGTSLYIWVAGPFVYLPDGKYTTRRHHVPYPVGMAQRTRALPGRGRHVFTYTVPPALPRNRLLIICYFEDSERRRWPWEVRRDSIWFRRSGGFFELETDRPGNLFTYDEPVRIVARLKNVLAAGAKRKLVYRVYDVSGEICSRGEVEFTVERDGQAVPIDLALTQRGTFLIEAEVEGWEQRATTFSRIPDVLAITGGGPTPFGMTNVVAPAPAERLTELCQIARRLGLTACRTFTRWYDLEPGPGLYRLDPWEKALDVANQHGIDTWMCLVSPPAWAYRGPPESIRESYNAVRCDWDAWRGLVEAATTRLRGKLYGWEWLNEITPGGIDTAVDDYLTMCRIGTETAKGIDPAITTILAGGLWPRSFRLEMLKAGVGKYADVLPVHYSNGGGVQEAREDLAAVGLENVAVWDDESAKGVNAWNVPPLEQLTDTQQSEWVLSQWTDELAAGCERIIYFGGLGDACGNYSYILDDLSPRPVAATLAVLASKLWNAEPLGTFTLGRGGLFHLFESAGGAVLVCAGYEPGEQVDLHVGADQVRITDHQGNERELAATGGMARLELGKLAYFLEGADPDVLKAYVTPEVIAHRAALKRSLLAQTPRVTMMRGADGQVLVRLRNVFDGKLDGDLRVDAPEGWPVAEPISFSLARGDESIVPVPIAVPKAVEPRDYEMSAAFRFTRRKLPEIVKPFTLSVISPDTIGNLMPNGGFEEPAPDGGSADGWRVNGKTSLWATAEGLGDGLGDHLLKFTGTAGQYATCTRTLELRGGDTYLYTAWVWNRNMRAGSNIYQELADGTTKPLYDVHVFTCGPDNPYWQMYTCRYRAPANLEQVRFVPLGNGDGWAAFDNIRVTLFEGTDFAAECHRATAAPRIDGSLDDWAKACPIPLIGRNQLTVLDEAYSWTSRNLNGIGHLMWDDENLYVGLQVRDDVHHAATGDETIDGDSIILAFDPTNRAPGAEARAFAYHVSSAPPGGGSGKHTILRPKDRSAGLRAGQLFKDSSVYDMAIARTEGTCIYELRIPLGELGGVQASVGAKFAFSLQLNDNDGDKRVAHMNWGEGISPVWRPSTFGVVTCVP